MSDPYRDAPIVSDGCMALRTEGSLVRLSEIAAIHVSDEPGYRVLVLKNGKQFNVKAATAVAIRRAMGLP